MRGGIATDTLRSAAASACFLAVVFTLAENIIPAERYQRHIKTIFTLTLALIIIPKFTDSDISLPDIGESAALSSEDYEKITEEIFNSGISSNICDALEEKLKENNIYPVKISVDINNSQSGGISITRAEMILSDIKDREAVLAIAKEALGTDNVSVTA